MYPIRADIIFLQHRTTVADVSRGPQQATPTTRPATSSGLLRDNYQPLVRLSSGSKLFNVVPLAQKGWHDRYREFIAESSDSRPAERGLVPELDHDVSSSNEGDSISFLFYSYQLAHDLILNLLVVKMTLLKTYQMRLALYHPFCKVVLCKNWTTTTPGSEYFFWAYIACGRFVKNEYRTERIPLSIDGRDAD